MILDTLIKLLKYIDLRPIFEIKVEIEQLTYYNFIVWYKRYICTYPHTFPTYPFLVVSYCPVVSEFRIITNANNI